MTTSIVDISDPNFIPHRDVERVWAGHKRHYDTGTAEPYDRTRALKQFESDGMSASESTLNRAITRYGRNGTIIPGLIPHWPIGKYEERPWIVAQRERRQREALQRVPVDQPETVTLEVVNHFIDGLAATEPTDQHLRDVKADVLELFRMVKKNASDVNNMAAVFVGGFVLLDVFSDGRLDNIVRWCKLLAATRHVIIA